MVGGMINTNRAVAVAHRGCHFHDIVIMIINL